MKNQGARISMLAIPMMICSVSVMSAATAWSDSDDYCSDRTLHGEYGWAAQGLASPGPQLPPQAPFSAVGVAHFDGRGNLSWLEHTIINGEVQGSDWTKATGTYTVNSNCTGTAIVSTPNSPVPLNIALVVIREGKEIRTVVDGHAINTVFIKAEDRR
jgi:hypothetical protein